MFPRRSLALLAPVAGLLAAGAVAGSASAATTQTLGCRASVARVNLLDGGPLVEPFVANPDGTPCTNDSAGLTTAQVLGVAGLDSALGGAVTVGPASATTTSTVTDSSLGARALVSVSGVSVPTPGGVVSIVGPVQSTASEACMNGAVVPSASSTLSAIEIGTTRIALAGPGQPDTIPLYGQLNLLGQAPQIGDVSVNEDTATATSDTETLLDVHVNGVADVVVGEASVSAPASGACAGITTASPTTGGAPSGGGSPTSGATPTSGAADSGASVCPTGTVPSMGSCVLPGDGGSAGHSGVIVAKAGSGDISGGRVISLALARRLYHSACLAGRGPGFVVVGTRRADHITVAHRRMRVLGLGGNDTITVKGGSGTCVDGGAGNDRIVNRGANRVTVYGGAGNDRITIGNGPATVDAGAGDDVVSAGTGRDLIVLGAGRNVVTARGAHVDVRAARRGHTIAHLRAANVRYARRHGVWRALVLRG